MFTGGSIQQFLLEILDSVLWDIPGKIKTRT
jgi:hypothetical protein